LNALIFLSSAAFFEGEERAAKASAASLPSPENQATLTIHGGPDFVAAALAKRPCYQYHTKKPIMLVGISHKKKD